MAAPPEQTASTHRCQILPMAAIGHPIPPTTPPPGDSGARKEKEENTKRTYFVPTDFPATVPQPAVASEQARNRKRKPENEIAATRPQALIRKPKIYFFLQQITARNTANRHTSVAPGTQNRHTPLLQSRYNRRDACALARELLPLRIY